MIRTLCHAAGVTVSIRDGDIAGRFPRRALGHILEWLAIHRDAVLEDWKLARARKPLNPIPPLE